jgi:hypothetical protein
VYIIEVVEGELTKQQAAEFLTLICLIFLIFFQEHLYELFLHCHLVLVLTVIISFWRHLFVKQIAARIYITVSFSLWTFLTLIIFLANMVRNFS